ncbi:MAG: polynucleotide kinase-phosphatase [bacterium]
MTFKIPDLALVVLIGPSGSGKSTFARRHFKNTEILSSDYCRGLVSDDENNQAATKDAFEVLHFIAAKRLAAGKLTVIDATNVQPEARKSLIALAREYHCLPVAIVLNIPEKVCHERNQTRPDRTFGPHVVRQQSSQLRQSLRNLDREGFRHVHILNSLEEVETAEFKRDPLWNNRKSEHGPFDIIGDVHGCFDELTELLEQLGYKATEGGLYLPPEGRKLIFVGDLVDRGPKSPEVMRLVMGMVEQGRALAVPGNHDVKFMRAIWGKKVQTTHGLAESLQQFEAYEEHYRGFSRCAAEFIDKLVSHYVFDDGKLVVAHAGMKEAMQGRGSGKVREFALFGQTTGETDEFGLPIRYPWAQEYRGRAMVVYGHTPVPEAEWLNRTIDIDTGCVFGGKLTALRYPELELVSVPARHTYAQPARPFISVEEQAPSLTAQQQHDYVLDLADVTGKRIISTRLQPNITIREENSIAALEVMSRFAVNPKWLIYLPPTMSPSETSKLPDLLEHPSEAFAYYRQEGIPKVICEAKHMGSRAVVVLCRDETVALKRFGIAPDEGEGFGVIYTRTGRRFFEDRAVEAQLLGILRSAIDETGLWSELKTDWICLDCELMPWSAKAQELIRTQYAAVGAASLSSLSHAVAVTSAVAGRAPDFEALAAHIRNRAEMASLYRNSYRRYCWPVEEINDFKLAPFHLLATEGAVHSNKDHLWHMEFIGRLVQAASRTHNSTKDVLLATPFKIIDVTDEESQQSGITWWEVMTSSGGEGMVVKPLDFIAKGRRGITQPAVKCRGREYLRIIYGAEYTASGNLERLKSRGLGAKRSLAIREFALGIEALERFVKHEPLRRVHECVFGVLALESEPVDPRL